MSYKLTGSYLVQKQLAYIPEVTYGTTPANPSFTHAGPITSIADSQETQAIKYRQVGNRDLYAMIKTGELYSFDVTYNPLTDDLINYAINLPGVGSQNIGVSLSFVKSALINNTEMFTIYRGCVANTIDFSISADSPVNITINYIAKSISTPSTSHGLGTVGSWGINPTLIPWTNLSGGPDPLRWATNADGTLGTGRVVDTPSWSASITNNIEQVKINGDITVKFVEPTNRDITFEFDTLHAFTDLIADQKGSGASWPERHMVYQLSSNRRLRFNKCWLESLGMSDDTGDTTPKTEAYTGTAASVVCESY